MNYMLPPGTVNAGHGTGKKAVKHRLFIKALMVVIHGNL